MERKPSSDNTGIHSSKLNKQIIPIQNTISLEKNCLYQLEVEDQLIL